MLRVLSTLHQPVLVGARTVTTAIDDEVNLASRPKTSHDLPNRRRPRSPVMKPKAVIAYSNGKAGIDFSD